MTIKRKVRFQDDDETKNHRDCGAAEQRKAKRVRRLSLDSAGGGGGGDHDEPPHQNSLWYSSLELRAIRKNSVLAMEQKRRNNEDLCNHLLHRSHQDYHSSTDRANGGGTRDGDCAELPYDEGTAQTILNIWTTGELRFNSNGEDRAGDDDDECRRGMESLCSSRLSAKRRFHRKGIILGVMLAQQQRYYHCNGDENNHTRQHPQPSSDYLQDRIARVSRVCSSSSRRFAELMGKADAMAAAHIHLINLEQQQKSMTTSLRDGTGENMTPPRATRPARPAASSCESTAAGIIHRRCPFHHGHNVGIPVANNNIPEQQICSMPQHCCTEPLCMAA